MERRCLFEEKNRRQWKPKRSFLNVLCRTLGMRKKLQCSGKKQQEILYEGYYLVESLGIMKKSALKKNFPPKNQFIWYYGKKDFEELADNGGYIVVRAYLTNDFKVEFYLREPLLLTGPHVNEIVCEFMEGKMLGDLRFYVVKAKADGRVRWYHLERSRKISHVSPSW